ncbi:MAG: FemAB family PEP-CTERM system-associated protein [Candidatus Eisenbacteria bacterium]|uniref:FemAB family PEP-CTERM system-associated protein n=1 Tax=Eiseniibacteriota bacterium TaxID=2212470 RepID=A0A538SGH1_UNCEI|nr:MAG: FemAB family PEP-CTERM system-associated protein [Candidatus Eisenbacteria bacterium]
MPSEAAVRRGGTSVGAVRVESNPEPEAWEAYVRSHPQASLFHGLTWHRVLERTFRGYQPCHRIAWRGGHVCGVLPLYRVPSLPFGSALVSTPHGVYGGVCADDEEVSKALLEEAGALARSMGARYVELRQEQGFAGLPTKDLYVCFRQQLHANHDANMQEIPGKRRRSIRLGARRGLTENFGHMDLVSAFYDVYTINMRHLGSPAVPRRFFQALLEEYDRQCFILGMFEEGRMVAGALCFYYRDSLMPYFESSLPDARTGANDLLYWSLMCHATERGVRTFDFGRSKRDSGSYHFKRHWGIEPTPLAYQYLLIAQREMPNLSPTNPKFSLAIRAWRKTPLPITRWLGPKLSPYFP